MFCPVIIRSVWVRSWTQQDPTLKKVLVSSRPLRSSWGSVWSFFFQNISVTEHPSTPNPNPFGKKYFFLFPLVFCPVIIRSVWVRSWKNFYLEKLGDSHFILKNSVTVMTGPKDPTGPRRTQWTRKKSRADSPLWPLARPCAHWQVLYPLTRPSAHYNAILYIEMPSTLKIHQILEKWR